MQKQHNTGIVLVILLWHTSDGSTYHRRDVTESLEGLAYPEIWWGHHDNCCRHSSLQHQPDALSASDSDDKQ